MGYRDDWFDNNASNHGWYTCAKCGRKLGAYLVDTPRPQRTSGSCPSCGKRYTVEYGNNKLKVSKG